MSDTGLRIGLTAYPLISQRKGGLEVQVRQTMAALRDLGLNVSFVDLYQEKLRDFDLIHHFSLNDGSYRIIATAKAEGLPCVVSPLVQVMHSSVRIMKIRVMTSLLHRIFGQEFRTKWHNTIDGLKISDAICALTPIEQWDIGKLVPDAAPKTTLVPNGITEDFFSADPGLFRNQYPHLGRFILLASSFTPYKNQLSVIRAARAAGYHTVLVGSPNNRAYFNRCMEEGGDDVTYLGELDYPSEMLTSLFAAADLVALVSKVEPFGLVPFEALAAGTPSLLTTASGVTRGSEPPYFQRVDPKDESQIRAAIERGMEAPHAPEACRSLVEDMRWSNVARQIADIYRSVTAD